MNVFSFDVCSLNVECLGGQKGQVMVGEPTRVPTTGDPVKSGERWWKIRWRMTGVS